MQLQHLVLAFLVGFVSGSSDGNCRQSLRFTTTKNGTCLDLARVANPAAFVQYPNGTCYFDDVRVCANATAVKKVMSKQEGFAPCVTLNKGSVKFRQLSSNISTTTVVLPVTKECPKFKKIDFRGKVLLLRTHASFGLSPYKLFRDGATSPTQLSFLEANKDRKTAFKSPLFRIINQTVLQELHIELYDEVGRLKVRLGFALRPGDDLREGRWFAKERLIYAWPWPLKTLKKFQKYAVFSIHGKAEYPAVRRFHISLVAGACWQQKSILAVVEQAACDWEKQNKYFPTYLFNGFNQAWAVGKRETSEFRMFGIFKDGPTVYARMSQSCK